MREFARSFYKSKQWQKCRQAYITTVHGLCERCGAGGKIVHHKIYLDERNISDPHVTLAHENLELLCQECHNIEHNSAGLPIASGLRFDSNGNIFQNSHDAPRQKNIF